MRPRTFLFSTILHAGAVTGIGVYCGAFAAPGRTPCPTVAFVLDEPVRVSAIERVDEPVVAMPRVRPEPPPPIEPWIPPSEFTPDEWVADLPPVEAHELPRELRTRVRPTDEAASEPEPVEAAATPPVPPPVAFVEAKARDGRNVPPRYPRESVLRGESGEVVVMLEIDARGRVVSVELHRGCGHPRLHRAVLEAARTWEFEPALEYGEPVATRKLHTTVFELR